jgi:hypothetical protein
MTTRTGPSLPAVAAGALAAWIVASLLLAPDDGDPATTAPPAAESPATSPPTDAPAAQASAIAGLLERADRLLARGDLVEPAEANALDHYRQVLALDPGNRPALAGLDAVGRALAERGLAIVADDLDGARAALEASRPLAADAQAVARLADAVAAREAAEALVTRIRERLAAGRLTTPEDSSAVALVREAFAAQPRPPEAEAARDAVVARLESVAADARAFDLDELAAPYERAARELAAL